VTGAIEPFDNAGEPMRHDPHARLLARFAQTFDRLLKGRDERTADELFKRQFMTALIAAVADAIETTVADRGEALRIQAAIASRLRRAQTEPAASRGA
jgi:hypothetical protein